MTRLYAALERCKLMNKRMLVIVGLLLGVLLVLSIRRRKQVKGPTRLAVECGQQAI